MDDNSSDNVSSGGGDNFVSPPLTDAQVPPAAPPSLPSVEPEPSIPQIEEKKEESLPPPELPKDELPKPNIAKSAVLAAVFLLIVVSSVAGYYLVRRGGLGWRKKAAPWHKICDNRKLEDVGTPQGYDYNPSDGVHSWGHFGFSCRPNDYYCGNANKTKTYLMTVIKCANDNPNLCGHGQGTIIHSACADLSLDDEGKGDFWWDYYFSQLGWQCGRYQFDICPGETCANPNFAYQFVIPCPPPTATPIPSPTATDTPTPTGTIIPSLTPTGTLVPTQTPTGTLIPTPTPTSTLIPSPTPTNTIRPTQTPTPTTPPGVPTPTPQPTVAPACNFVKVYKVNADGTKTLLSNGALLTAGDRLYLEASFKLNLGVQKAMAVIRRNGVVVKEEPAPFNFDPPGNHETDYRITFYYDIGQTGNYEVGAFYYYGGSWH